MLEQVDDSGKASVVSELGEKVTKWSEPAGQRGRGDQTTHSFGVRSVCLAGCRRMDSPHLVWIDVDSCWKATSASDKSEKAAAILCEGKARTSAGPKEMQDALQTPPGIPSTSKQLLWHTFLLLQLPSVPQAATRVVSPSPLPASTQGLSWHRIRRDGANHSPFVKLLSASQKY